jgi:hypothetical protein
VRYETLFTVVAARGYFSTAGSPGGDSVSNEEPANTCRPSGRNTERAFATCGSSFERKPLIVTI